MVTMLLSHLCWNKIWVVEGGNTIVTPLLKQNMDCLGWRCYCHTSVETKYGLLRVTILLSHLCWNKIGIVEGDNAIVIPLMKQNICCLGWKCYCRTCWNKIWIVTPLLHCCLGWECYCHTSVESKMGWREWQYYYHTSVESKYGLSRVMILLLHLCWNKIYVV